VPADRLVREAVPVDVEARVQVPAGDVVVDLAAQPERTGLGAVQQRAIEQPGTYAILARFEGAGEVEAGTLAVGPGERVLVRCNAAFRLCARASEP